MTQLSRAIILFSLVDGILKQLSHVIILFILVEWFYEFFEYFIWMLVYVVLFLWFTTYISTIVCIISISDIYLSEIMPKKLWKNLTVTRDATKCRQISQLLTLYNF